MTEQQKSVIYANLLDEHRKLFNEINRIKADSLDLNKEQQIRVNQLERQQQMIMEKVKRLFS